ncbi:hypothetical protein IFR05_014567, partial [Cadophora sp. M221]
FSFLGKQGNDFSVVINKLDILGIKARLTSDFEDANVNNNHQTPAQGISRRP